MTTLVLFQSQKMKIYQNLLFLPVKINIFGKSTTFCMLQWNNFGKYHNWKKDN